MHPDDSILLCGLAIFVVIFWIGVFHLHIISIIYGKWRLHKPTAKLRIVNWRQSKKSQIVPEGNPSADFCREQSPRSSCQTIIQVETTCGTESNLTLFNGELLPGVSILKPLVGVDQYLMHNLESFFLMSYPKFELLFCVAEESDPAIMVVQSLLRKYPDVDARLFIGGENVGVNPKINNMMPGYRASKYELLMVSDSGIMMKDDTLLDMVYTMLQPELERDQPDTKLKRLYTWFRNRGSSKGVGLVHQMPFSVDRAEFGFPACLEKVYFGTAHARIYLAADCIGINCPTGMSALMRKPLLENQGGMAAFGKYLAEDYFFAKACTDQGWSICISSQPAWQNSAVCQLSHFQGRLERWAKLRYAMIPVATVLESFQECLALGILAAMSMQFLFGLSALGVFLAHMLTWFFLDWTLLNIVQNDRLSFSKLDFVISWLFRESTCVIVFAKALLNPNIQWKNGYYRLRWGGVADVVKRPAVDDNLCVVRTEAPSGDNSLRSREPKRTLSQERLESERTYEQYSSLTSQIIPLDLLVERIPVPSKKGHFRTRSLPQKGSISGLIRNFTDRIQETTCDDFLTRSFSIQTKKDRDIS